jgi:anion-transporting  ArsA/GET3 family ATPase
MSTTPSTAPAPTSLAALLRERRILVCVGSGGVGKTTTAATLALGAARAGRRTLVLTIDPARRLANSLGLDQLGHDLREVPRDRLAEGGLALPERGALFAMMLDQKRAFDELVARHAKEESVKQRIFANPIYRQISSSLAGSHEYAAMSKLYELQAEGGFDLIILDTPPTANALDFLDAPQKLSAAIDSPAIEWLTKPYVEAGRFSMKALGMGAAFVLGRLAKFVGSQFLDDMARFFVEFNQILGGFRERALKIYDVLRKPDVAFVLVSSAEPMSVDEALYFYDRLASGKLPLGGFVVNRVHPRRPALEPGLDRASLIARLESRPELRGLPPDDIVQLGADLQRTHAELDALAVLDRKHIDKLRTRLGPSPAPIVEVPLFERDVHDLPALGELLGYLAA